MYSKHDCLPHLNYEWGRSMVRPIAMIVILWLTMAFTVVLLAMKLSPAAAVGMLTATGGWTIRISRFGRRRPALRRSAVS